MAKKQTEPAKNAERPADQDEYFRRQSESFVLPPELRMTIRDGFRFGIGFVLAMLVFYVIVIAGLLLFLRLGKAFNIG